MSPKQWRNDPELFLSFILFFKVFVSLLDPDLVPPKLLDAGAMDILALVELTSIPSMF